MGEKTKTPREPIEVLFSYPGSDSMFAIEKNPNNVYGSIRIVENIPGAESIRLGSVEAANVGRFLTWLRRMCDN